MKFRIVTKLCADGRTRTWKRKPLLAKEERDSISRRNGRKSNGPNNPWTGTWFENKREIFRKLFWSRVNKAESCWWWTGSRFSQGYGRIRSGGKYLKAHRVAWQLENGPIPENICVLHQCDNPPCVRPEHLFLGTIADNNQDKVLKGRCNAEYGEKRYNAKLSVSKIKEIRTRVENGEPLTAVAKAFSVNPSTIKSIVLRRRWKQVP